MGSLVLWAAAQIYVVVLCELRQREGGQKGGKEAGRQVDWSKEDAEGMGCASETPWIKCTERGKERKGGDRGMVTRRCW